MEAIGRRYPCKGRTTGASAQSTYEKRSDQPRSSRVDERQEGRIEVRPTKRGEDADGDSKNDHHYRYGHSSRRHDCTTLPGAQTACAAADALRHEKPPRRDTRPGAMSCDPDAVDMRPA